MEKGRQRRREEGGRKAKEGGGRGEEGERRKEGIVKEHTSQQTFLRASNHFSVSSRVSPLKIQLSRPLGSIEIAPPLYFNRSTAEGYFRKLILHTSFQI
jgi:hypothetical protein